MHPVGATVPDDPAAGHPLPVKGDRPVGLAVVLHLVGGRVEGLARPLVDPALGIYPELVAVGKLGLVQERDI